MAVKLPPATKLKSRCVFCTGLLATATYPTWSDFGRASRRFLPQAPRSVLTTIGHRSCKINTKRQGEKVRENAAQPSWDVAHQLETQAMVLPHQHTVKTRSWAAPSQWKMLLFFYLGASLASTIGRLNSQKDKKAVKRMSFPRRIWRQGSRPQQTSKPPREPRLVERATRRIFQHGPARAPRRHPVMPCLTLSGARPHAYQRAGPHGLVSCCWNGCFWSVLRSWRHHSFCSRHVLLGRSLCWEPDISSLAKHYVTCHVLRFAVSPRVQLGSRFLSVFTLSQGL